MEEWAPGKFFYNVIFTLLESEGNYQLNIAVDGKQYSSAPFEIGKDLLAKKTIGSIIQYYNRQRANTPQELAADSAVLLYGSNTTVDMRGGWCDASGDVSKYFSHLAYANYMSPQQIPLVTWSMISADEAIPAQLKLWGLKDSLEAEHYTAPII
ncbi:MAG: hypothetical protein WDM90_07470 [Ferruginibacter sp.]